MRPRELSEPHLDLTGLIRRAAGGDAEAADRVFAATYHDLTRLARLRLSAGGRNTLLDTTSLVHESYLRFASSGALRIEDPRLSERRRTCVGGRMCYGRFRPPSHTTGVAVAGEQSSPGPVLEADLQVGPAGGGSMIGGTIQLTWLRPGDRFVPYCVPWRFR